MNLFDSNPAALIRTAGPADVPDIAELAGRIWRQYYPGIISRPQIEYMLELFYDPVRLIAEIQEQKIEYRILFENGEPIGFSSFGQEDIPTQGSGNNSAEDSTAIKLHKLYLLPACHGRGFGSLLLRDFESDCRLRSIGRIRLNVNKNNVKAIRSYERNGYQTADAVMIDIGGGYFMDDYIMEKRLEL